MNQIKERLKVATPQQASAIKGTQLKKAKEIVSLMEDETGKLAPNNDPDEYQILKINIEIWEMDAQLQMAKSFGDMASETDEKKIRAIEARKLAKEKELELILEQAGVEEGIQKGEAPASGAYEGPQAGHGGVKAMKAAVEAREREAAEADAIAKGAAAMKERIASESEETKTRIESFLKLLQCVWMPRLLESMASKYLAREKAKRVLDSKLSEQIELKFGSPWWVFYHGACCYLAPWNAESPEELADRRKEMMKAKLKQQAMERVKADKAKQAAEAMGQGVPPPPEGESPVDNEPLSPSARRAALEERLRAKKAAEDTRAHEKANDLQEGETEEEAATRRKEETKAKLMAEAKARVAAKKAAAK